MAGKALVAVGFAFLAVVAFQGILAAVLYPSTSPGGPADAGWLGDLAAVALRGGALAAIAAGLGFAVAGISRNTAASIGAGFAYLLLVENFLAFLRPGLTRWLFIPNAGALVAGGDFGDLVGRSALEAGLLLAAYASVALVAAFALFRARDVA